MSKTLKVTIKDKNTLQLQEQGNVGDTINLSNLHANDIDKDNINNIIQSFKDNKFNEELARQKQETIKTTTELITAKVESKYKDQIHEKDHEIDKLKGKVDVLDAQWEIKIRDEIKKKEEQLLKYQQEIERLKNYRIETNTKLIGESLEQYCENQFAQIGRIGFPNATFTKDTDTTSGTKGDYIYREFDENNNELLSIMFEMKNEQEDAKNKQKNDQFYKKLDKDRNDKKCEFAVLVTTLEKTNDLFSNIVTVTQYQKMYVIRPQHFILIIDLLRQGALRAQEYKKQIIHLQSQDYDFKNFENNVNDFKNAWMKNVSIADNHYNSAIKEIDDAIKNLQEVKEKLMASHKQLGYSKDKVEELSVKRLTKNAPSIAKKIYEK